MLPLHRSALFIRFLTCLFEALGEFIAVRLERFTSREVIPTTLAEVYGQRVRLISVTVPLDFTPLVDLRVGTEAAPDLANRPAYPVGLRLHE